MISLKQMIKDAVEETVKQQVQDCFESLDIEEIIEEIAEDEIENLMLEEVEYEYDLREDVKARLDDPVRRKVNEAFHEMSLGVIESDIKADEIENCTDAVDLDDYIDDVAWF